MTVSERVRSCWGPTWLARRSPVKQASEITSIAFEWTTKRFLWCPFQCVEWWRPHQSLQPSFMALSSEQSSCSVEFGCRSLVKLTLSSFTALPSSVCLLFVMWKNLRVFVSHNSAGFYWTFHLHILYERLKELQAKVLHSTCQTIKVCKQLQSVDFDGTQEVLPCSSRFLRALQQNRAQSRLLYLLSITQPRRFHGKINGIIQFADFWVYYTACWFKRKSCEL